MLLRVVTALVAILTVASCGGGSNAADRQPASIVPASAFLYAEANLDPQGDQEEAVRTVLAALPGVGPPEKRLQEMFNSYAQRRYGRRAADFGRDIEPWLGDRIATFALLPADDADVERTSGGLLASVSDESKAKHWLFVTSRQPSERERTYRRARYLYDASEKTAAGLVDGFVVEADEGAFKALVDNRGRPSLAKSKRFASAATRPGDQRLGLVWYDTHQLLTTIAKRTGGRFFKSALPAIRRLIPDDPLALTVRAKKKALVLDGSVPAAKAGALTSFFDEGGSLMDQLPRDALAVVGQPNFGDYLRKLLALSNAAGGGYAGLRRDLRRSGFDLERDLLGWMTDAAVFVRKDRDGSLGGALVVQSGDARSVYDGALRLGRWLFKAGADVQDVRIPGSSVAFTLRDPGLHKPLVVAEGGKRLVVGYGRDSAAAALSIGGLGGQAHYEAARERLGLEWGPAAYVDMQRLIALLKLGQAKQLLEPIRYVIVGGRRKGGVLHSHSELVFR